MPRTRTTPAIPRTTKISRSVSASTTEYTVPSPTSRSSTSPANGRDLFDTDDSDQWEDEHDDVKPSDSASRISAQRPYTVEEPGADDSALSSKRRVEAPLAEDHLPPRPRRSSRPSDQPEATHLLYHHHHCHNPTHSSTGDSSASCDHFLPFAYPADSQEQPRLPGQWPEASKSMEYAHSPYAHAGAHLVPYGPVDANGYPSPYAGHYGYLAPSPGYSTLSYSGSYLSEPRSLPYHCPLAPSGLDEDRFRKLELLLHTQRDELVAMEKVRQAQLEREKKEAEEELKRIMDERKAAQLVADAAAKAKAEAEIESIKNTKALLAEHKLEMEKQKATAEKYKKEAETTKKDEDSKKGAIKFKDGVGRKFTFPYRSCKTWKGIEELINQAFPVDDFYGLQVRQGHYSLAGPDNDIILPQVWESAVQADWTITMNFWDSEPPISRHLAGLAPPAGFGREQRQRDGGNLRVKHKSKTASKRDKGLIIATSSRLEHRDVLEPLPPPPAPPGTFVAFDSPAADGPAGVDFGDEGPGVIEVLRPVAKVDRQRRRTDRGGGMSSFFAYAAGRRR